MDDKREKYSDPEGFQKGTIPSNYRPITRLHMTWKILIAQIRKEIYYSHESCWLFLDEQKAAGE